MFTDRSSAPADADANVQKKLFFFRLGKQSYGIPIECVRQVMRMASITPVPQMPAFVAGVTHVRGQVVPLIDLRIKFGLGEAVCDERTCLVLVNVQAESRTHVMGFLIDRPEEVVRVKKSAIEPAPHFTGKLTPEFVQGIVRIGDNIKILLDANRVLAAELIEEIDRKAVGAEPSPPSPSN